MTSNNGTEAIEGTVQAVNEKGVKVNGSWYNRSQYGPDGALPRKGEHVVLQVSGGKWIKSWRPLDGPTAQTHNGTQRETTITRLACLKAAAEFAASRPDAKSADVLKIAEAWEAWVNRG
jgi:hypothetical protein